MSEGDVAGAPGWRPLARRGEQLDDIYRELGRFVVAFSLLQYVIESGVVNTSGSPDQVTVLLAGDRGPEAHRSWVSLRELLRRSTTDPAGLEVIKALNREVTDLIEKRNLLLHGGWFLGWGEATTSDWSKALVLRKKAGTHSERMDWTAEALAELVLQVDGCAEAVGLASAALLHPEVEGILALNMEVVEGLARRKQIPRPGAA